MYTTLPDSFDKRSIVKHDSFLVREGSIYFLVAIAKLPPVVWPTRPLLLKLHSLGF